MTTTTSITDQQRLTLIKHLAAGKTLYHVALIMRLDESQVLDVASRHGYPKTESLSKAAEILARNIDQGRRDEIPQGSSIPSPAVRPAPQSTAGADQAPVPAVLTRPDDIQSLLNTAKGHPSKKVQTQANRCLDAIDKLRTLIRDDEDQNAAKRQAAADRAEARAEVDRLKAQLAAAQAALRSTATTPTGGGTSPVGEAATIRAWAMHEGLDVPARGRIPAEIRDQYTTTHPATEPAEQAS